MTDIASPLNERERVRHKWRNRLHSAVLLTGMIGLFALCAGVLFGADTIPWVLTGGTLALLLGSGVSPRLVLSMYKAVRLGPESFPEGVEIVRWLARRAGLSQPPDLHYIPSTMVNAFAVGNRRDSAIAVTEGMLRALNQRELAAVFAHEISHIRNNDLWIMSLADAVSRLTAMMAYLGVLLTFLFLPLFLVGVVDLPLIVLPILFFAPTIGSLLQLALSRAREYDADLDAVGLTGDPSGLASALAKIDRIQAGPWERLMLPGARIPEPSLLRTHPRTDERIRRLMALGAMPSSRPPDTGPITIPRVPRFNSGMPRRRWTGLWY